MSFYTPNAKPLYRYESGTFERELYRRLREIGLNPNLSQGFKALAQYVCEGWEIRPTGLSTAAIKSALLAGVKQERQARDQLKKKKRGYWPEIFDAFIRTADNGCRFDKWCAGQCEPDSNGTREHWSAESPHRDLEYGDSLNVQVFHCVYADGSADPATVALTYESGDGAIAPVNFEMTPVEARKFGEAFTAAGDLKGLRDRKPGRVIDLTMANGDRMTLDLLVRRTRRGERFPDRRMFEISLFPEGAELPVRMVSDYSTPWFLGSALTRAADDAEGVIKPMFDGWEDVVAAVAR